MFREFPARTVSAKSDRNIRPTGRAMTTVFILHNMPNPMEKAMESRFGSDLSCIHRSVARMAHANRTVESMSLLTLPDRMVSAGWEAVSRRPA